MEIVVKPLLKSDWNSVSRIYKEGIATGIATFETDCPDWIQWDAKYISKYRYIAIIKNKVVGFAVLAPTSKRKVYNGVAEVSVYVEQIFRGNGIGNILLNTLINESEKAGFWTLQASIFSENRPSIKMHLKCGFKTVGIREKIGKLNGKWYDNHLLERRSKIIN